MKLTIPGAVIGESYSQLLMVRTDLPLEDVLALDRVQKGLDVSEKAARHLRRVGLIEGRKPTVGVIASRGDAVALKGYLDDYIDHLGLSNAEVLHDSGHVTRCRSSESPLGQGRILLAGDAAGLLEPFTREGAELCYSLRNRSRKHDHRCCRN